LGEFQPRPPLNRSSQHNSALLQNPAAGEAGYTLTTISVLNESVLRQVDFDVAKTRLCGGNGWHNMRARAAVLARRSRWETIRVRTPQFYLKYL